MTSLLKKTSEGVFSPLEARRIVKSIPSLKKWIWIPIIINIIILLFSFGSSFVLIPELVTYSMSFIFTAQEGLLYTILAIPLSIVLWLGFIVFAVYFTFIISTVVASPFHSLMVEKYLVGEGLLNIENRSFSQSMKTLIYMFFTSIKKAVIFVILGIILFALSFVPILNIPAAFCAFLIISFDCFDYSFETLEWPLKKRIDFIKQNRFYFFGHGIFLSLTSVIPGLTIVLLPYGILGGSYIIKKASNEQTNS